MTMALAVVQAAHLWHHSLPAAARNVATGVGQREWHAPHEVHEGAGGGRGPGRGGGGGAPTAYICPHC